MFFTDSITGWAQTSSSTISHTINGGGPITSAIPNNNLIAADYKLYQNYPNPFNPSTSIKYYLKSKSFVELKIYDISGKEVINLVSKEQGAGDYEKSIDFTGKTSGIYFYRLIVRDNVLNTVFSETKRMIYLK
ncbi:MAG: T9SS type A sorting domain-containing protein [Ignavibacteria bacterium]|nr:T9SS type A sorting domain-containing protein [Ignavibacteria bacterium]